MSAPLVRAADIRDVDAIEECVRAAFEPFVERIGKPPAPMVADYPSLVGAGRVWVAECGGRIAGVLVQYATEQGFYLDTVAVSPSSRGTGVGRALLQFAERQAVHCGFDSIYLEHEDDGEPGALPEDRLHGVRSADRGGRRPCLLPQAARPEGAIASRATAMRDGLPRSALAKFRVS